MTYSINFTKQIPAQGIVDKLHHSLLQHFDQTACRYQYSKCSNCSLYPQVVATQFQMERKIDTDSSQYLLALHLKNYEVN